MKYIALCIMCKDDEQALIENINYHTALGVDHFLIYDNESKMPLSKALKEFKNVTVHSWTDSAVGSQIRCYNSCLADYRDAFKWIGFIDTDEFIVIKDGATCIKQFMKAYESYGGLGINWLCFGSSGHTKKQKSIIKSYVHAVDVRDNIHIKSIVNTKKVDRCSGNPHAFIYKSPWFCVNEAGERIISSSANAFNDPPTRDKIQLNHYVTRSREDFELKVKRGGGNARKRTLTESYWERFQGGYPEHSISTLIDKIARK